MGQSVGGCNLPALMDQSVECMRPAGMKGSVCGVAVQPARIKGSGRGV